MKGRKGGESPQAGVVPTLAPPPATNGSRVMAAAKRRKRGGRVAVAKADSGPKVEGKMAPPRLDKPKRARGGIITDNMRKGKVGGPYGSHEDSNVARQTAKANSQLSDIMSKKKPAATSPAEGEAAVKSIEKKLGRKRGGAVKGEVGADDKPFTHAKIKTAGTKGHSTEANIT